MYNKHEMKWIYNMWVFVVLFLGVILLNFATASPFAQTTPSPNSEGIINCKFTLNSDPPITVDAINEGNNTRCYLDLPGLSDGAHNLTVVACNVWNKCSDPSPPHTIVVGKPATISVFGFVMTIPSQ